MNILVLGGTRFFGRRLVNLLLQDGHTVTVATRGETSDGFGEAVQRIRVDRTDGSAMRSAFDSRSYDVVFDQLGFTPREAAIAVDAFGDRIGRYVFTSSMAVYPHHDDVITEEDFRAEDYPVDLTMKTYDYAEGKRQAEAYLTQNAPFPVVRVRVAMVISGSDDYTGRFDYYVRHVAEGQSIGIFREEHPISYVTARDVAQFLRFIGATSGAVGPVNATNGGPRSIQELAAVIGQMLGREPRFHEGVPGSGSDDGLSPYAMLPYTWRLSNARAGSLGFVFPLLADVLPPIVRETAERLGIPTR